MALRHTDFCFGFIGQNRIKKVGNELITRDFIYMTPGVGLVAKGVRLCQFDDRILWDNNTAHLNRLSLIPIAISLLSEGESMALEILFQMPSNTKKLAGMHIWKRSITK